MHGEFRSDPMKVVVDHNLCEGNGRCVEVAPQVFELRDDDLSYVLMDSPPQELRAKIQLATTLCPRQAIRLVED
jgi:ferredoxin